MKHSSAPAPRVGLLVLLLLSSLVPVVSAAAAQGPPNNPGQKPAKTTLIIKMAKGLTLAQAQSVLKGNGATPKASIRKLDLHVVEVPAQAADAITKALKADKQILRVETDHIRKWQGAPSDTQYPDQWALPKISWDQVYGVANPRFDTKVAILDTGVDATHPELTSVVVPGWSVFDADDGRTDENGHGTWVAGIVAARTDNLQGIAGVGYDHVQVMPVKVLDPNGLGQDSDIIQGLMWAVDNGASVILMAFNATDFSDALQDAIDYAWAHNVVLVAAAGNEAGNTATFPAGDRGVIGVSATDQDDNIASSSTIGGSVFLAAPGVNILGTYTNGGYVAWSGTSASAAIVAGAAALMRAIDPSLSNGVIVNRIAESTDAAGTQEQTGNGRINLARAIDDTSTTAIQPTGTAPLGGGGPFVGPYRIAAIQNNGLVSPNSVAAGSTNNFQFLFKSQGNTNSPFTVTITVPAVWTTPTTAAGAGQVTLSGSCATGLSVSSSVITITGPSCGNGQTFTVNYNQATAPSSSQTYTFTITGSNGNQSVTVTPAPTKLAFLLPALSIAVGQCSGPSGTVTVQSQDVSSTARNVTANTTVTLSKNSVNGTFYSDAACLSSITTVSIPSGSNSASFFFKDTTAGTPTITAHVSAGPALTDGTQLETINPANTTTAVSSNSNPSTTGELVTFTATISVTSPGAGSPTGTVNFREGTTTIGTCGAQVVSANTATCATAALSIGTHDTINAVYSGDGNSITSTSANFSQTVNPAPFFKAVITPTTDVVNHSAASYSITITDCNSTACPSQGNLNDTIIAANITIPADYSGVTITTVASTGHTWDSTIAAGQIQLTAHAGNDKLSPGDAVTVTFTATTPSTVAADPKAEPWNVAAYGANNNSKPFAISSAGQPSVSVSRRTTLTAVTFASNPITYGQSTTATVTVTDKESTGTETNPGVGQVITVSSNSADTITGTCTLAVVPNTTDMSSCQVTVTPTHASVHNISATFAPTTVHKTSSISSGLTVNPLAVTITPDGGKTKVYGSVFSAFTGALSPATLPNGDAISITYASTGAPATANVSDYDITSSHSFTSGSASNYTVTDGTAVNGLQVQKYAITITPDGGKTKTYGSVFSTFTGTITGLPLPNSDAMSVSYASAGARATAYVGSYDITSSHNFTSGIANNYTVTDGTVVNGLQVQTYPITITPDGGKTKTYGSVFSTFTGTVTELPLPNGDAISVSYASAGAPAPANAGSYAITSSHSFTNGIANNYSVTDGTAVKGLEVLKANPTITVTAYSVTFDGSPHMASGTAKGVNNENLNGLVLTVTIHTDAGNYPLDPWTFTDVTGNYNNANGTVTDYIDKANANITVTPYSVTFDGFLHTATGLATGIGGVDLSAGLNLNGTTHTTAENYSDTWTFTGGTNYKDATSPINDVIAKYFFDDCHGGTTCDGGSNLNNTGIGGRLTINATVPYLGTATAGVNLSPGSLNGMDALSVPMSRSYPQFKVAIAPDGTPANPISSWSGDAIPTVISGVPTFTSSISIPLDRSFPAGKYKAYVFGYDAALITSPPVANNDGYSIPDTTNYKFPTLIANIEVVKADQTITFAALSNKTYGDADFAVSATSSSGLAVEFSSQTTSVCTVSGTTVHIIAAGTCTVRAAQPGNANYNPAPNVDRSFTVDPLAITITPAGGKTKIYGSVFTAFTGTVTPSTLPYGDAISATYASAGAPATANVGDYDITSSHTFTTGSPSNYTVTDGTAVNGLKVNPLPVTITADGGKTKIYGSVFSAFTGTMSPATLPNGDAISITYASVGLPATANVGYYDITSSHTFTNGNASNYSVTNGTALNGLQVQAYPIVITPDGGKTKTYGSMFSAFTGTVSGLPLPNGDAVSVSYASLGSPAPASVGYYDITSSHTFTNGNASNYSVTDGTAVNGLQVQTYPITITPAGAKTKTYGSVFSAFTGTVSGLPLPNGDAISVSYASTGSPATANVSYYDITSSHSFTSGSPSNYNLTDGTAVNGLQVQTYPITITPDGSKTTIYGSVFNAFTGTVSGLPLPNGDAISVSYGSLGSPATANVSYYNITSSHTFPNGNASNYSVTDGTALNGLQVNPAASTTSVSSSKNPSTYGDAVTFTATVTNTATGATPTGTVQFVVDGQNFGSPVSISGNTNSATGTSQTTATLSVNGSPHTVTATYSNSDGNFIGSNGGLTGGQRVNQAATSTSVSSSKNPSTYGDAVTFTATVTNTATGATPTGTVQFVVDGQNFGSPVSISGNTNSATGTSQATATLSVNGSPHTVTATYSNSDGNFIGSNGILTGGQRVNQAATITTAILSGPTIRYKDSVTLTARVKPANTTTPLTGSVSFTIGAVGYGSATAAPIPGDPDGTVQASVIVQDNELPGNYTVTANFTSTNPNYSGSSGNTPLTVIPRNADPYNATGYYTGDLFAWTTGQNSSAATVTMTVVIKDNNQPRGDVRAARVTFYTLNGSVFTPISSAQNLPVGLIDQTDGSYGSATAIVQLNIGSQNSQGFQIAVGVSGGYTSSPSDPLAGSIVTVAKPVPGGQIVGGGTLTNSNSAGLIKGANGEYTRFHFDVSYNKSLTNPQGKVTIYINSYYKPDGTLDSKLHNYIVTSNAISVLSVNAPKASFSSKSNVDEQMADGSLVNIDGGATLQLAMTDATTANTLDTLAITLTRKSGGTWFSSNLNSATAQTNEQQLTDIKSQLSVK